MPVFHKVAQGECLASLAKQYGFANYLAIWNHPKNGALQSKRKNPNILLPGDMVFIPDKQDKQEERSTGWQHQFQVNRPRVLLRVVIRDGKGQPYANKRFSLAINNHALMGVTTAQGLLEKEVPVDATQATLTLCTGESDKVGFLVWKLFIGHLDPPDSPTGVQARLNNLGFYCGAVDGIYGIRTARALRAFQLVNGIPDTGKMDAATCERLRLLHDRV